MGRRQGDAPWDRRIVLILTLGALVLAVMALAIPGTVVASRQRLLRRVEAEERLWAEDGLPLAGMRSQDLQRANASALGIEERVRAWGITLAPRETSRWRRSTGPSVGDMGQWWARHLDSVVLDPASLPPEMAAFVERECEAIHDLAAWIVENQPPRWEVGPMPGGGHALTMQPRLHDILLASALVESESAAANMPLRASWHVLTPPREDEATVILSLAILKRQLAVLRQLHQPDAWWDDALSDVGLPDAGRFTGAWAASRLDAARRSGGDLLGERDELSRGFGVERSAPGTAMVRLVQGERLRWDLFEDAVRCRADRSVLSAAPCDTTNVDLACMLGLPGQEFERVILFDPDGRGGRAGGWARLRRAAADAELTRQVVLLRRGDPTLEAGLSSVPLPGCSGLGWDRTVTVDGRIRLDWTGRDWANELHAQLPLWWEGGAGTRRAEAGTPR